MKYTTQGARFATLSEDGDRAFRKQLWRGWHDHEAGQGLPYKQYVLFVGLNPSIADETTDDMTIKKCVGDRKSVV